MKKAKLEQKIQEGRSKKAPVCHACVENPRNKDPHFLTKRANKLPHGMFCGKKWYPQEP